MTDRARRHRARVPLLALGMVALLAGLWGGLLRLGWPLLAPPAPLAALHGPLMISGFLGTVIALERAVALGRLWAYGAPLATGLGVLALVAGAPGTTGPLLMTLGSAWLVVVGVALLGRQPALPTLVMTLGAGVWLGGQILWLAGAPVHRAAPWWAGFLVLTIAAERLELSRLVRVAPTARVVFLAGVAGVLAGLALATVAHGAGVRLAGAGLLVLAAWLARHDVARRTVRQPGLTRFIALCLLSGYCWLGVSGALAVLAGGAAAGPRYDAFLHALLLGFVFSMIFGYAPVIFPAVVGWRVPFAPRFYVHLCLLHATLALRVAGDLLGSATARDWGGLGNVLALLLFLGNTGYGVLGARRETAAVGGAGGG